MTADLVLMGGNLITLDRMRPRAAALAVRDGRFVFIGDDAAALALAGPQTLRIELGGRTVVPGFCDAHLHLLWYGTQLLRQADLVGSATIDDLLTRLSDQAAKTGNGWIQGHGFDQDKLSERRFPTRAAWIASRNRVPFLSRESAAMQRWSTRRRWRW